MKRKKKVSRSRFLGITTTATAGILIFPWNAIKGIRRQSQNDKLNVAGIESGRTDKKNLENVGIENSVSFSTSKLNFSMSPTNGAFQITDRLTKTIWHSNPFQTCFGGGVLTVEGKSTPVILSQCVIQQKGNSLIAIFHPLTSQPSAALRITIQPGLVANSLNFSYEADPSLTVERIRLLDNALWTTDVEKGYVVIPIREGLLIPADSGLNYSQSFDTYAYEGCHMTMVGIVKNNATALITWNDPYTNIEINSQQPKTEQDASHQILSTSVVLSKTSRSFQVQFCGRGDYVTLAQAYRNSPQVKKWNVPWSEKLKQHPEDAKLFGASNIKLWSTLSRTMSPDSSEELSKSVNWTFDEAAQVAEHFKNDLKIDLCLFIIGGWINRGYDNQHPDIMPSAPECGGDNALADCSRRVMNLGYLFCLHDNYQDIYRDSPSWNEDYIMKKRDGSLTVGGRWNGGRAYLTCSQKAVELARRPQNLLAVKKLTDANSYFIDTTFAAELKECFDLKHPLTRADDMYWKQVISDYAREIFGVFGSEGGREWALPHSDFFEGLTGVHGRGHHNAKLQEKLSASIIPLFEIVYRDGIAMYGKYDYNINNAAEYVLQHIILGRTLNYHNIPSHLYWKEYDQTSGQEKSGTEDQGLFVRGDQGWTEGLHPIDRFVKNTHEILGPLNALTAQMPMTEHRFLSTDRKIQQSVFGKGREAVVATVNMSSSIYTCSSQNGEAILLPLYGFLVEAPTFSAFHALNWNGVRYDAPPLFAMHSLDDKPLTRSKQVHVFHGFGDNHIKIGESIQTVPREAVL
ncbi:MAG: hypothetical protein GH151_13585 [Bacteroidetes bacterium]|nr:hypothetical protein [Bacteroidota bacterium]